MYAYGTYGVIREQGKPPAFDAPSDLQYHPDQDAMLTALRAHCDLAYKDIAPLRVGVFGDDTAARWTSFKKQLTLNRDMPHQQQVAPNGRIYWWLKLV